MNNLKLMSNVVISSLLYAILISNLRSNDTTIMMTKSKSWLMYIDATTHKNLLNFLVWMTIIAKVF